jgi:putative exosortase-associated protein (TIGR04073 family)
MRKLALIIVGAIIISSLVAYPCFAQGPMRKLGRGLLNTITGLVEIPKEVILTSKKDSLLKGLTWGWVKGIGTGLLRTASGVYETVTFPIPAPADYEPMVKPEFVFEEWE